MNVIEKLYINGFKKDNKVKKIISKINKCKTINSLYVITLPLFEDGILEIYSYNQLLQPYYKAIGDKIYILGIAPDKSLAEEIITMMVQELLDCGKELWRESIIEYLEI